MSGRVLQFSNNFSDLEMTQQECKINGPLLLNSHHMKEIEKDCETSDSINPINMAIVESHLQGIFTSEFT